MSVVNGRLDGIMKAVHMGSLAQRLTRTVTRMSIRH